MRRRRVLLAGASAISTLVAGCSSGEADADTPPTTEPNPVTEPDTIGTPPATAVSSPSATGTPYETHRGAFRAFLEANGLEIVELTPLPDERRVRLRYVSRKQEYQEIGAQVGMIAGGFFRRIGKGWEMDRLDATILDPDENPRATWFAKRKWFEAFLNKEITAEELSLRVLDTLEPVNEGA